MSEPLRSVTVTRAELDAGIDLKDGLREVKVIAVSQSVTSLKPGDVIREIHGASVRYAMGAWDHVPKDVASVEVKVWDPIAFIKRTPTTVRMLTRAELLSGHGLVVEDGSSYGELKVTSVGAAVQSKIVMGDTILAVNGTPRTVQDLTGQRPVTVTRAELESGIDLEDQWEGAVSSRVTVKSVGPAVASLKVGEVIKWIGEVRVTGSLYAWSEVPKDAASVEVKVEEFGWQYVLPPGEGDVELTLKTREEDAQKFWSTKTLTRADLNAGITVTKTDWNELRITALSSAAPHEIAIGDVVTHINGVSVKDHLDDPWSLIPADAETAIIALKVTWQGICERDVDCNKYCAISNCGVCLYGSAISLALGEDYTLPCPKECTLPCLLVCSGPCVWSYCLAEWYTKKIAYKYGLEYDCCCAMGMWMFFPFCQAFTEIETIAKIEKLDYECCSMELTRRAPVQYVQPAQEMNRM